MSFRRAGLSLFCLIFFIQAPVHSEIVWQMQNTGILDLDVRSIDIFSKDNQLICAAAQKHLYLSQNGADSWQETFSLGAEEGSINFVAFDALDAQIIFLATNKGLLVSKNQGQNWQQIFRKVGKEEKDARWIAQDRLNPQKIYLGVSDGLYFSPDLGASWQKLAVGLPQSAVRSIALHPRNSFVIYLANAYGLFKTIDGGQSWKRIYLTSYKASDEAAKENNGDEQESTQTEANEGLINCIAVDQNNPRKIFIATGCGVLASDDAGESWNKLPSQGLSNDDVNFILVAPDKNNLIYAATKNGIFVFSPSLDSWQKIYRGMTFNDVRSLAGNIDQQQLFAGTDHGVFRAVEVKGASLQEEIVKPDVIDATGFDQFLKELVKKEPTINQVQEAALRYAQVIHPRTIQTLRQSARLKALLPDVSLDYDKTIYGGYGASYQGAIIGPRDWSLSLSWDVGDLVFNEQLRLLDSNTRLMVQLRDDIINAVTRLYYERRKLQTELILTQPKTPGENLTKNLRLEELTANLDGLTGGYFSRNLNTQSKGNDSFR